MKKRISFPGFQTIEIVLMAVLAIANAIMSTYLSAVSQMLTALGGPIATSTIVGLYMIYGVLAVYIIRKPGTALMTYLLGGIIQSFLGNSYGIAASLVAALCYAAAVELMFAVFRYKYWNAWNMMLVGFSAVPLWFLFAANMFGYLKWETYVLVVAFIVRCISGMIMCGLLSKFIGDAMARTGMLRPYAISRAGRSGKGK